MEGISKIEILLHLIFFFLNPMIILSQLHLYIRPSRNDKLWELQNTKARLFFPHQQPNVLPSNY